MSDQFIGEIRVFGFNFAPQDWAMCNGQIIPIAQNVALFAVIGTTYGGNGTTNYALPNMQSSTPIHMGQGPGLSPYVEGQQAGEENITLTAAELPAHTHTVQATTNTHRVNTSNGSFFAQTSFPAYVSGASAPPLVAMNPNVVGVGGGNAGPHENRQPFLALNFCIALQGIFPPR